MYNVSLYFMSSQLSSNLWSSEHNLHYRLTRNECDNSQWQKAATMPLSGKQVFQESEAEYRTIQGYNIRH